MDKERLNQKLHLLNAAQLEDLDRYIDAINARRDTPKGIVGLVREWEILMDAADKTEIDLDECPHLQKRLDDVEKALCTTRAASLEELEAQLGYARRQFRDAIENLWAPPFASILDTAHEGANGLMAQEGCRVA